jgi:hydroxyacylglutathione hydrolase
MPHVSKHMILRRFYDRELAQASYLIACSKSHAAVVIDPNRDVAQYLAAAAEERVKITHVTETHIHADFVSGARELAARTGATLLLSGEGGTDWQYGFAGDAGAVLLRDGDAFSVGHVRFDARHVPGHTPEHLAFVVTDTATSDKPVGVVTGDFVFAGDVGRPDLLERAANVSGSMDEMARLLFRSLARFRELPDYLQLWPGHGAGSACGKGLGALPSTTIGYERVSNWAFAIDDEATFVAEALRGQSEPPRYFARMKRLNRDGPPAWNAAAPFTRVGGDDVLRRIAAGSVAIDVRTGPAFVSGHVPGSLGIAVGTSFSKWAGSLVSDDAPIVLIDDTPAGAPEPSDRIRRAHHVLMLIGMDLATEWAGADALETARRTATGLEATREVAPRDLVKRRDAQIIDVRDQSEWLGGHIEGARLLPLASLSRHMNHIDRNAPVVLHCQGGGRSITAASLLRANGFTDVSHLAGGADAWTDAGLPLIRDP